MNTTTDSVQPGSSSASSNAKPLWIAVGILGAAVLAMGGTMLYQRPAATSAPVAALTQPAPIVATAPKGLAPQAAGDDLVEKPTAAPVKPAPAPAKKVVTPTPRPAAAPTNSSASGGPATAPQPQKQACSSCATVESVTPIQRTTKSDGPGMGAVAGGVLGAVLGNQVGQGNGRTAATVLGAVGGGFAGNAIEANMKKVTVYQVGLRMDDGSRRTMEISQAPAVGSQVTVEGANLRLR